MTESKAAKKPGGFSRLLGRLLPEQEIASPWLPAAGPYPQLLTFDTRRENLDGKSGVYALWHLGVRPQWLKVAATGDLGTALMGASRDPEVTRHKGNNGVFVAWTLPVVERQAGIVRYLVARLKPSLQASVFGPELSMADSTAEIVFPLPRGVMDSVMPPT